jgi:hypothetical protein
MLSIQSTQLKFWTLAAASWLSLLVFALPAAWSQSVCLPAPRLLTTLPMGGQAGTELTLTIAGDYLEDTQELWFSDPRIVATPMAAPADAAANPSTTINQFLVRIAADVPAGVYEARVMTRLGLSTSRTFSVGELPEVTREHPNTSLESAMALPMSTLCNATITPRAVDHYTIEARQGGRLVIDCSASGIDSKAKPVLILADAEGRDLAVERRGEALDYEVPADGKYIVKVHDLTFAGGPHHFYRLVVRTVPVGVPFARLPSTRSVSSFSWPPVGLTDKPHWREPLEAALPSDAPPAEAYTIALPCDIQGSFYPAADVDTFEFEAVQGDVWWVEVGSERMGLPTDPAILVQYLDRSGAKEAWLDLAELTDIPSPVKPSSNAYAYDGPPYDGGSPDIIGKIEIKHTGLHRLHIRDLFGGTRNDPRNTYRLVIRQAEPDFALVAWAFHMELRNGDRAALSKPLALRTGATMALEVVAVRRDGFSGPIELEMRDLPTGVTATGLSIPAGQSRGMMLVSAADEAPRGMSRATLVGRGQFGDTVVERPCHLASMAWPVPDAWQEIPSPRLLADVPVSVSDHEQAPLTLRTTATEPFQVTVGQKLTIPMQIVRRSEFSGASMPMRVFGDGFSQAPAVEVPLTENQTEITLDLAALKTPPGEYQLALYGNAVAKFALNPQQPTQTTDIVDIIVSEPIRVHVLAGESP